MAVQSSAPRLTCSADARGRAIILAFHGSMGASELATLEGIVEAVGRLRPRFLIVDLLDVPFIASMGIRAFVQLHKVTQERGGCTALVAPNQYVSEVLRIVGLERVLPVYASIDAACAALPPVSAA